MRAAYIETYGGSDQLKLGELPTPEIGPKDILIEVHAASVNPVDWKIREGHLKGMLNFPMPLVLGWDIAGTVAALGREVSSFKIGDAVFSRSDISRQGTYAQMVAVDAQLVVAKPESLSFEEAASLPLVAHTAWQVMFETMDLRQGNKIFIGAGSGGVGTLAIQLAHARGAHVITSTSTTNLEWVRNLGADEVIDYTTHDPNELVRDMDYVFDTMGGADQTQMYAMLRHGGQLVSISKQPDEAAAKAAGVRVAYVFMQPTGVRLENIAESVLRGELRPVIDQVFALEQIREAHDYAERGHAKGKVVIRVK
jgi:NADPH:quinone reductase-like Zn-dependent oxidoreductase